MSTKVLDLSNQSFGRLIVLERGPNSNPTSGQSNGFVRWWCACECGNKTLVFANALRAGKTRSCGCLLVESTQKRRYRHGKTKSAVWVAWLGMLNRCQRPSNKYYKNYGGRGIVVCDGLKIFENFYDLLGDKPKELSLDRCNNEGNYSCGKCQECFENEWPNNIRWATKEEQSYNTRRNVFVLEGEKYLTIPQYAKKYKLNKKQAYGRLKRKNRLMKRENLPKDAL